jgi:hypothetical protein
MDYYTIAKKLETRGFRQAPANDAPICRWTAAGLQLDVVPTDPEIIGFSNRWYALAAASAMPYELASGQWIRLITAPLFLATKLEAFADRGRGDVWASHDLEDFVTVIDGRSELLDELKCAPASVREYLRNTISDLLAHSDFNLSLTGHLPGDSGSQARLPILRSRIRAIAALTD